MKLVILRLSLVVLSLVACAEDPLREDVIAQARPDGRIAFDVVKIDEAVLTTMLAQPQPPFREQFKPYRPPPELKIAVGDTISVVIWESAPDGLFGNSLTELEFPAGASARLATGEVPASTSAPSRPQDLTASPETFGRLFGGATDQGAGALHGLTAAQGAAAVEGLTTGQGLVGERDLAGLNVTGFAEPSGTGSASQSMSSGEVPTGTATTRAADAETSLGGGTGRGSTADAQSGQRQIVGVGNLPAQRLDELLRVAGESGRPGTRIPDQQVAPDGAISIPYAGRVKVAGRTNAEVQHTIDGLLGPKALNPQALVITKRSASNSVTVAGEVVGGARVPLSPGGDRLLQVIAAAGGAKAPVHDTFVQLSRGTITATVPLATLVADPAQDIFAEPGDVLTLVRRPQTFSVFGATGKNAALTFTRDRLSLSEALAKAGGLLDDRADPRAVFLFRNEPVGLVQALGQPIATAARDGLSPIVYRLDLKEAQSYHLASRFAVHDKDVIFVTNAATQPIYQFFQVLSVLTGPIQTAVISCYYAKC